MTAQLGDRATISKTITEADIAMYTAVSLDTNPVHLDEVQAAATPFGGRIAHGMLSAGLISAVLGTKLPGPGTVYLSQDLRFVAPVRIGDTVTAEVIVTVIGERGRVTLETTCTNHRGERVVEGSAVVVAPRKANP